MDGHPPISGRVAVCIEDDNIQFTHINSKAPYAKMHAWKEALEKAFPEMFEKNRREREHQRSWRVEVRYGGDAFVSYELLEANTALSRIDVSRNGELRNFRMKIDYFKEILQHIIWDIDDVRGNFYIIEKTPRK